LQTLNKKKKGTLNFEGQFLEIDFRVNKLWLFHTMVKKELVMPQCSLPDNEIENIFKHDNKICS